MTSPRRMRKTALLAAPLGALALSLPVGGAAAADIVDTLEEQPQFSTLAEAMTAAGITQSLQGEGPYTLFAPTDQAFAQLPAGALDALMKGENREQLKRLLQYHVIEGQEIMAADVLGRQSDVATASGERFSLDGTGQMILLVPARAATAQQQPSTAQPQAAQDAGVPSSPHQEQVLRGEQGGEQPQTAAAGDMPSSPHQEQVLRGGQGGEPQAGAQQPQAQDAGVPSSPHQEQVLRGEQGGEQQTGQTAAAGDMPSSPHQEQVLRGGQDQGIGRDATVVEADIEADNGVIHAVDALLVPPSLLSVLENADTSAVDPG
jgi:transforming growth factor-beta-induced protein